MVKPSSLISVMRAYKVGAIKAQLLLNNIMRAYDISDEEAQWLLNARVDAYKLLSTGQVIEPNQSI